MRTFTEQEVALAVMAYSEGCPSGKREFLAEALGIHDVPEMSMEVTLTVTVKVPAWDTNGTTNEDHHVSSAVRTVLGLHVCDIAEELDSEADGVEILNVRCAD